MTGIRGKSGEGEEREGERKKTTGRREEWLGEEKERGMGDGQRKKRRVV